MADLSKKFWGSQNSKIGTSVFFIRFRWNLIWGITSGKEQHRRSFKWPRLFFDWPNWPTKADQCRGGRRPRTVRYLFLIFFCSFIIAIVFLYLPGVYFLNACHQTFNFYVIDGRNLEFHNFRTFLENWSENCTKDFESLAFCNVFLSNPENIARWGKFFPLAFNSDDTNFTEK